MRDEPTRHYLFFVAAIVITVANVILIWAFRFLPLYDYPIWLYNVRVMMQLSDPQFSSVYELVRVPIPNLGLVGPVWLLSHLFTVEVAGKIFLSLCVAVFPWSFYYCFTKISGRRSSPLAYLGFPFAMGYFFYSGHAFLFATSASILIIGYFLPKIGGMRITEWLMLAGFLVLVYFIHAFGFLIVVLVFTGSLLFPVRRKPLGNFLLACVPGFFLMMWYLIANQSPRQNEIAWTLWSASQSIFKPFLPFIKSFGISNPFPLTLLNLLWMLSLFFFLGSSLAHVVRRGEIDKRFIVPFIVSSLLTILLPHEFLGIAQPGIRFGLLSAILVVLLMHKAIVPRVYSFVLLGCSFLVIVYNIFHFSRVEQQMNELYKAITTTTPLVGKSFATVRFDWPTEIRWWDGFASPFHPLYGAVYYAGLSAGGPAWAFDTALLRMRRVEYEPSFSGKTVDEYASAVVSTMTESPAIDILVFTGRAAQMDFATAGLQSKGVYQLRATGECWRILEKCPSTSEGNSVHEN